MCVKSKTSIVTRSSLSASICWKWPPNRPFRPICQGRQGGEELENARDSLGREESPAERLSLFSGASQRIHESLDVDTVFRAVMDGARSLTGAANAVITTLDGAGRPVDFTTCAGKDDWTKAEVPGVSAGAW